MKSGGASFNVACTDRRKAAHTAKEQADAIDGRWRRHRRVELRP